MDIKQRLDKLRELLLDQDFQSNRKTGNEVGLYIFAYNPKDEMPVRHFIESLKRDYSDRNVIVRSSSMVMKTTGRQKKTLKPPGM